MTETEEEAVWIARSQRGDSDAFASLVRSHQRMIHDLAFRMTGSMTASEDLAQETFIRVYERIPEFRSESKFSSWLYRIAVNLCLDWRLRERRRDSAQQAWAADQEISLGEAPDTLSERVQRSLLRLPPKQRAVIVLTIYEGMSHGEAAAILGCREATVAWRAFAARRRLARILSNGKEP